MLEPILAGKSTCLSIPCGLCSRKVSPTNRKGSRRSLRPVNACRVPDVYSVGLSTPGFSMSASHVSRLPTICVSAVLKRSASLIDLPPAFLRRLNRNACSRT